MHKFLSFSNTMRLSDALYTYGPAPISLNIFSRYLYARSFMAYEIYRAFAYKKFYPALHFH